MLQSDQYVTQNSRLPSQTSLSTESDPQVLLRDGRSALITLLKNTNSELELVETISDRDCFLSSITIGLSGIKNSQRQTIDSLKELLKISIVDSHRLTHDWKEDDLNQTSFENYRDNNQPITTEILSPWGTSPTESTLICAKLHIFIHLIIIDDTGIKHRLIKPDGIATLSNEEVNYHDINTVYIAVQQQHYVPLISKNNHDKAYTMLPRLNDSKNISNDLKSNLTVRTKSDNITKKVQDETVVTEVDDLSRATMDDLETVSLSTPPKSPPVLEGINLI